MSQLLADPPQRTIPTRSRAPEIAWSRALATAAIVVILTTAVVFRIWRLGSVPGLNGDEAWSGVQALRFLHGEPIAWRTPTGNPINVFFFGPEVLLHAVAMPSIALLRIVPLVSGLLALLVNYWFCRRVIDRNTAVISTLFLAALPINIAYSRFAWDASQSLLATLPVVYLSLMAVQFPERFARYLILGVLALMVAVLVHPTNIFVTPLLVVAALFVKWDDVRTLSKRFRDEKKFHTLLVGLGMVAIGSAWLLRARLAPMAERMFSTPDMLLECKLYLRLLSGATIYRFISGRADVFSHVPEAQLERFDLYDLAALLIVSFAAWNFVRRVKTERDARDRVLGFGTLAVVAGFYLVAGPQALAPHFERYAICLIAPTLLVVSRGVCVWGIRSTHAAWPWLATCGTLLICMALLVGFYVNYLHSFAVTGGDSHRAFRTAEIDPKQDAVEYMLSHRRSGETTWIVGDEWWTYWPAAYLAYGQRDVNVVQPGDLIPFHDQNVIWDLEFTRTRAFNPPAWDRHPFCERRQFDDPTGTPIITIFRRTAKKFPE